MPFWRRERPLHERLAEEGGLAFDANRPPPHDPRPRWGEVALHGLHRPREYDVVATVEAVGPPGSELAFVVLPDGTILLESEETISDEDLDAFAAALAGAVEPPFRCTAVRRGEARWVAGAKTIEVAQLETEIDGDVVSLSLHDGTRTVAVDGGPAFGSLPELEKLAGDLQDFVVEAERLDGDLWEIRVTPL